MSVRNSSSNAEATVKTGKGETSVYRTSLEQLRNEVPYTEVLIVTTLPRGTLQIAQPATVNEGLLKAYAKEFHTEDRLTWQTIIRNEVIRLRDAWSDQSLEETRYYKDFLQPAGLVRGIAAPLVAPMLEGYPGAVHLYRNHELGEFTSAEMLALGRFAHSLDASVVQMHDSRPAPPCNNVLPHVSHVRQFVFNGRLQSQLAPDALISLDARLREAMLADAKQRLSHLNGRPIVSDRVPLADARGDLWNFRVVVHKKYPALGDGPFIFFCQQPACKDWGGLRASDFQADAEISRLVPALKFMQEHFSKGPTLISISKTVHLSPFHFHRRFTELLGITPKHFLLDCQIEEAKRMLVAGEKELVDIAKACGFAHQSHFTSRFKQATGLTPTRWRRLANDSQLAKLAS